MVTERTGRRGHCTGRRSADQRAALMIGCHADYFLTMVLP
jgi:hypothetical protein